MTLVFLHYFGGASTSWEAVTERLQNEVRCLTLDLLGFGRSPTQEKPISVADSTKALQQCLAECCTGNYLLIGHSMGGKIALNFASSQPAGLQGLLLFAPSPPSPEPMDDDERIQMINAFGDKAGVEKMISAVTAPSFTGSVFEKEVAANLMVSENGWRSWPTLGSRENISAKMKDIRVPVSIFCGSADQKFTKAYLLEEFSNYFDAFSLTEIPGCGHLLPAEAPEQVAAEIKKAMQKLTTSA